jgi:hypothetical protein
MYKPALLSVHGAGRSFELLVMYHKHVPWGRSAAGILRTQIFSSREGKWGAARDIHIHNRLQVFSTFMRHRLLLRLSWWGAVFTGSATPEPTTTRSTTLN